MKQKIYSIILLLLVPGLLFPQELLSTHQNEVDELGRKQGEWKVFDGNGNLKFTGKFQDDRPVGEFTYYYPDGKVRAVIHHLPREEVAYATLYHPNGVIMAEGKYIGQQKDSVWNYYSDVDGELVSVEIYEDRVRQGTWKTYYPDGQVAEEVNYKDGLEQGPWVQYFTDGSIKAKGEYHEGKLEGLMQHFHVNGKVHISGEFRDGKKTGTWMYFNEEMDTTKKEVYKDGHRISEEVYLPEE